MPARPGVKSADATFGVLRIVVFLDVAGSRWDRSARHNGAGFEGKHGPGWVQICCPVMVLAMIGRWLGRP